MAHVLDPLARFQRIAPTFVPVPDVSWYLAGVFHQDFFVASADLDAAFAAVREAAAGVTERQFWDELDGWDTLEELCEMVDTWPELDDDGNLVGFGWAADGGPFPIFEAMAPWVRDGSFFLLEDDTEAYWRLSFEGGKLVYYAEAVAEDWLERARADAAMVRERLLAAGWRLSQEEMDRDRLAALHRFGRQDRADVDLACPVTHLRYAGRFNLRLSYRGGAKRSWLELELREGTDQLRLCVTVLDPPEPLLSQIVEAQDRLAPETWAAWLRGFAASWAPSIHTHGGLFARARCV